MSGNLSIPLAVLVSASSIASGFVLKRFQRYKPLLVIGASVTVIGAALLTNITVNTPTWTVLGFGAISGIGIGIVMQIPISVARAALPPDRFDEALGSNMFFRILGTVIVLPMYSYHSLLENFAKLTLFRATNVFLSRTGNTDSGYKPEQAMNGNYGLRAAFYTVVAAAAIGIPPAILIKSGRISIDEGEQGIA